MGEHLISDQAVGLIELIKNSYDADATDVRVEIQNISDPDKTTVIVSDNGCGMTLQDIEEKWLSPAADHKDRDKRSGRRTPRGRIPIGEKGVGRFAAHQIGRRLEMVTRSAGAEELALNIDWDDFEAGDRYLDSVSVQVIQRTPIAFTGILGGTRLVMSTARHPWTDKQISKVHRTLRRLQSPLDENRDFQITLVCPEKPDYQNVDSTDILDRAHYQFRALVDDDGTCDFEYKSSHPALTSREVSGTENLARLGAECLAQGDPHCGPFWVNLYVWDRSSNYLKASGVAAGELDAQCGVSLFRDNLRVLPYGEPGDDWLFLDQERVQAPADRIGNNQVIGLVLIDQSSNLKLRDKTNREGLIENEAFQDLRDLVKSVIRLFALHWKRDRPRQVEKERPVGSVARAKTVASAIRSTAREDVTVTLPQEPSPVGLSDSEVATAENHLVTVTQRKAVDLLIEQLDGAEHSIAERERRLQVLLSLAGTGLAAERVVHEFGRRAKDAWNALDRLALSVRGLSTLDEFRVAQMTLNVLRSEFRVLAPYEFTEKQSRKVQFSVKEAAEVALLLNKSYLHDHEVVTSIMGTNFTVQGQVTHLIQVLDNLIDNACHWISVAGQPSGERRLAIHLNGDVRTVVVADTGPGIHPEAMPHLFEAFFTTKPAGKGLGLFISAQLMKSLGGSLRISRCSDLSLIPSWATGAAFILDFASDTTKGE